MSITKKTKAQLAFAAGLGFLSIMILPTVSNALVAGACDECHTMHDSQDNAQMAITGGPYDVLLLGDCLSCHTGTNDGTNARPYVYNATSATYGPAGDTLAGGNFYWVDQGVDSRGHNVDFLDTDGDTTLAVPPGFDENIAWSARVGNQSDMQGTADLTCAGTAGCHGDRTNVATSTNYGSIKGAHHTDDSGGITGTSVGLSFRFLDGILGTEDADGDWEYQATAAAHNGYWAAARTANDTDSNTATISSLCAQCHGGFHNSDEPNTNTGWANTGSPGIVGSAGPTMTNPWIRHPTDFDMPLGAATEDYYYNQGGTYVPNVPLGSTTGFVTVAGVPAANNRIVMCISCHRAHGSPYADLLRWSYGDMVVGSVAAANTGCFVCHSAKDG